MKSLLVMIAMTLLLTGCLVKPHIVEDICMVLAITVDAEQKKGGNRETANGDAIRVAMSVPMYQADRTVKGGLYTGTGKELKDTISSVNYSTSQFMSISKLEVFIVSEEILKSGIGKYVEELNQDPMINGRLVLAMTEERAEKVLQFGYDNSNLPLGRYIFSVVENNINTFDLPRLNMHQFVYEWKGAGMDPVMPLITTSGNKVVLAGIVLLRDDAYAGKLSTKEMMPYAWLKQNTQDASYVFTLPEDSLMLNNLKTRRVYEYRPQQEEIHIRIHVDGDLTESGQGKATGQDIKQISRDVNQYMKQECEALIAKLQQLNVDSLGVGDFVRSQSRTWSEERWKAQYPKMKFRVSVESEIRR